MYLLTTYTLAAITIADFWLQTCTMQHKNGSYHQDTGCLQVVVRIRPMNDREVSNQEAVAVQVDEQDPRQLQLLAPGPKGSVITRAFQFHGCLSPQSKQSDVLKICGITQLLDAALSGYHATVFAYGQTGSGKTYTMSGHEDVIESDDYAGRCYLCINYENGLSQCPPKSLQQPNRQTALAIGTQASWAQIACYEPTWEYVDATCASAADWAQHEC